MTRRTAGMLAPRTLHLFALFQALIKELHTHVPKYCATFQGDFQDTLLNGLENAVDKDVEQAEATSGEVADKLK